MSFAGVTLESLVIFMYLTVLYQHSTELRIFSSKDVLLVMRSQLVYTLWNGISRVLYFVLFSYSYSRTGMEEKLKQVLPVNVFSLQRQAPYLIELRSVRDRSQV